MALAFDTGADFAIDKPAGLPCPHLDRHLCTIHDSLKDRGFTGCTAFDCTGAGQRTVALYAGQSWQDHPALLPAQSDSFRHLRRLHGRIELLLAAATLSLPPDAESRRKALLCALSPEGMTPQIAQTLATGPLPAKVDRFLKSLAIYAAAVKAASNP